MDTSVFITDNNMVIEDTDSDTSSTSTAEELTVFAKDKVDSNIKSDLASKFVKPIGSHGFYNKAKS